MKVLASALGPPLYSMMAAWGRAFAEEVLVWVLLGAAVFMAFAEEVSVWVICDEQECQVRVSSESVLQKHQGRLTVLHKC